MQVSEKSRIDLLRGNCGYKTCDEQQECNGVRAKRQKITIQAILRLQRGYNSEPGIAGRAAPIQ
jgi:hypothetical protein